VRVAKKRGYPTEDDLDNLMADARNGDWDALAQHIEAGHVITDEMREFLAGVLRKEIKRSANRPPKASTRWRHLHLGLVRVSLQEQAGLSATKADDEIIKRFGVDRSTIQRAMRVWREEANKLDIFVKTARLFSKWGVSPLDAAMVDARVNFPWGDDMTEKSRADGIVLALVEKHIPEELDYFKKLLSELPDE
jgi:hypothetical protein